MKSRLKDGPRFRLRLFIDQDEGICECLLFPSSLYVPYGGSTFSLFMASFVSLFDRNFLSIRPFRVLLNFNFYYLIKISSWVLVRGLVNINVYFMFTFLGLYFLYCFCFILRLVPLYDLDPPSQL